MTYETVRALVESVARPWLVWSAEPLELVSRVFWQGDPRNRQLGVRWLNGTCMRTTDRLMDEMSAALQFPHYFGRNWPALVDCLSECEWEPRRSQLLIVRDAASLLADEPDERLELFLDQLEFVAGQLSEEYQESFDQRRPPTPFHVMFHETGDGEEVWLNRLAAIRPMPSMPIRNPTSWE